MGKPDTEENRAGFVATVPMGRPSTPEDVANACCYLASDEAAFITGVNLEVRMLPSMLQLEERADGICLPCRWTVGVVCDRDLAGLEGQSIQG